MELQIKLITATSATALSELAITIYKQHYLHLWNEGGADWYMHQYAYPIDVLTAELNDENNQYYFVYENDIRIGYLKLKLSTKSVNNALEIERIYLDKIHTGKGFGKKIMAFAESIAIAQNNTSLVLKAMDSSKDAIAFYLKLGFKIIASSTLSFELMKPAFRGMVTLQKNIQ
jgi:diamine N-acetyltransferase